jgi:hypothetical protein
MEEARQTKMLIVASRASERANMRHPLILVIAGIFAARSLTLAIQSAGKSEIRPIISAENERDLLRIITFCLVGLLVTFGLMVRYPNLGMLIAEYNQF